MAPRQAPALRSQRTSGVDDHEHGKQPMYLATETAVAADGASEAAVRPMARGALVGAACRTATLSGTPHLLQAPLLTPRPPPLSPPLLPLSPRSPKPHEAIADSASSPPGEEAHAGVRTKNRARAAAATKREAAQRKKLRLDEVSFDVVALYLETLRMWSQRPWPTCRGAHVCAGACPVVGSGGAVSLCASSGNVHICGAHCAATGRRGDGRVCMVSGLAVGPELVRGGFYEEAAAPRRSSVPSRPCTSRRAPEGGGICANVRICLSQSPLGDVDTETVQWIAQVVGRLLDQLRSLSRFAAHAGVYNVDKHTVIVLRHMRTGWKPWAELPPWIPAVPCVLARLPNTRLLAEAFEPARKLTTCEKIMRQCVDSAAMHTARAWCNELAPLLRHVPQTS